MKIQEPQDIFKAILGHLTEAPVKVDSSKACYILNDYFEKGITFKDIKTNTTVTKYIFIKK